MRAPMDHDCADATTRSEAARRNGALSRGPVTPEGKARSAMNATRHGLCARTLVLEDGEDAVTLAELRAALFARWQPVDAVEAHRVEELVFAAWREVRLRAVEDAVLARAAAGAPPDPGLPSFATLLRYRARIERDARAATEQLLVLRRGRGSVTDPAQLRWLAERLEHAQAILAAARAPAGAAAAAGTNEPTPDPSEPTVDASEPGAAPAATATAEPPRPGPWPRGTNEPRHGQPPLAVARALAGDPTAGPVAAAPPDRLPAAA